METLAAGWVLSNLACLLLSAYAYFFVRLQPAGYTRLAFCLPVFPLYACIPWIFHSADFPIGVAILFCCITWLASFRLFNFCWDYGAASDPFVLSGFFRFHAALCFPIHIQPAHKHDLDASSSNPLSLTFLLVARLCVFALILWQHDVWKRLHPLLVTAIYSFLLYTFVTMVYEFVGTLCIALINVKLGSYFDRPYLASTFEEFWSRRWNILVSSNLRETVYNPLTHLLCFHFREIQASSEDDSSSATHPNAINLAQRKRKASSPRTESSPVENKSIQVRMRKHGRIYFETVQVHPETYTLIRLTAMMATFFVSGVMHETAVYYLTLKWTWEMLSFFLVHGILTASEAVLSRNVQLKGWKIPRLVRNVFTVGITVITGHYLFFAPLLRENLDIKVIQHLKTGLHLL